MKADDKSDCTIHFTNKALTYISKHASLTEPEAVKMFIATLKVSDSYKKNLCIAYSRYYKHYKIQWNMPKYRQEAKNVALPTREKLLVLISNAEKLLSMRLQPSMETGLMLMTFEDWVELSKYVKGLMQTGVVNFDFISNQTLLAVVLSEASYEQPQALMKDWNIIK